MVDVRFELPDAAMEAIAVRAAAIVLDGLGRVDATSPYMSVPEAAEFARCARHRIYDLLSTGRLSRYKDGSRVLVLRAELEAYLAGRAAPLLPPLTGSVGRSGATAGVRAR